ncbi:hypothetical protein [Bdellovibrio svalbardensis]|uniref:Secreted protein n=1 Tax=Bdellovibrio svalbardensis TaxID=2972972 RepID=A0ABT6DMA8_9BACT|nr:hypothetical protein [Bdellovibrio svalbardensis]MDG0818007.1 hypothetical protein [Bdellovibrio svalbardensis]
MKTLSLTVLIALSFAMSSTPSVSFANTSEEVQAKSKGKSEPAPKDQDDRDGGGEGHDPREGTYEGNDRNGGGSFDGGGYSGGDGGGGMAGELFYVKNSGKTLGANVKVEDRGSVLVYTETSHEDISASETCTTITRVTVDKATGKTLATDKVEYCNQWPL